ncbi:hypothetical protein IMZ48_16840, partial [Candidatus Bathyarchaeota archaeon]|nr:hypothetical protein [Candidatus Bathyarchaeota archaeon]
MGDVPLKPTLARPLFDPRLSLQTPPSGLVSPTSAATHSNASSGRSGKNVAFSSLTEYKDAPQYGTENRSSPPSGPLIPSARASKPPKGILKPFSSPNPLEISFNTANGAVTRCSLVDMLESTLRQLAGDDRADKVDAYGTLSCALRASNNLPDRVALQDRMPRFMEYVQRDITTTPLDPPLANHALTFLSTILFFPGVSSSLTSDFGIFMIDHCIRSFGDSTVPKEVTRNLLQVVAQQNFSARVMTLDRVTRLLTALHNIENHVTGKSIIHSRIVIYRRLMKQCKPAMLAHTGWLQDLITDTISTTKDIRAVAIAFGFEASLSIGKNRQISKKLAELFRTSEGEENSDDKQPSENKREYIDLYIERLRGMLLSRQDPSSVPKIWSVVLLLLRGIQLDKWQSLNPFLGIIQKCFNASDMQTRREANYAWNRFVYVLYIEEASFSKLLGSTLCSPVCSQWKRKANAAKNDEEFQTAVFGSACNLFYYMFKPGVSHAQLDKYWDKGLKKIMQQLCAPEQGDERFDQAICIFTNLFDSTTRRQWSEDRVLQNPIADASELPPLDPRWLRRNASRVFQLVQPILERKFSDLADGSSPVAQMWKTLITSVASAASKEIKVSFETTEFISHVFTSLLTLWRHGVVVDGQDGEKQRRTFLASTREFVTTVVSAFGVLPFTEKQLCSREDVFTPVTTPSHRPKTGGVVLIPLHHLFSILSSIPVGVQDDEAFSDFFEAVFRPFSHTKNPKAYSELAQDMINSIPVDTVSPYGPWVMVAGAVKAALAQGPSRHKSTLSLPSSNEMPVGREYRDLCKILERGFKSTPNLPWEHWFTFFGAFENHVGEETGDSGRAIAVVEPLAKMMLEHIVPRQGFSTHAVFAASALLLIAKQPADRQAVDAARRRLWGTTIAKSPTFDPFDNLYKLSNVLMEHLYSNLDSPGAADLATSFMEDLETFLAGCN